MARDTRYKHYTFDQDGTFLDASWDDVKTSATLRGVLALASRCLVLMYKVAI
jgi:hypothetical protein